MSDGYIYNPPNDTFNFSDNDCQYRVMFLGRDYLNITRYNGEKVTYCYDHRIRDNRIDKLASVPGTLPDSAIIYINKVLSMKAFL